MDYQALVNEESIDDIKLYTNRIKSKMKAHTMDLDQFMFYVANEYDIKRLLGSTE